MIIFDLLYCFEFNEDHEMIIQQKHERHTLLTS
ncbi:CLUMA_CG002023, isoform A [Clunio marinus]|uniref:CLUMA_CG002023, isoform A n=1 Tax=Clunio marinus TaxID=568069 RepID=A0A1J1HL29_9DIPT|nr:CLUMA_CG002023, isoform A [Clunio marinus]